MNKFMFFITYNYTWIYIILLALLYSIVNKKKANIKFIALLIITISITDLLCYRVLKANIQRFRPCHEKSLSIKLNLKGAYCGGDYGMPSNHASNTVAAITLAYFFFGGKYIAVLIFVGLVVSFSRVYLGVHYPSDILAGWLFGYFVAATLWYFVFRKFRKKGWF